MKPIHYVIVVVLSFVSGLAAALLAMEAGARVPVRTFDTIKAEDIQLIGSDGKECLRMVVTEEGSVKGPGIYMGDTQGKAVITIVASNLGPRIRLGSPPGVTSRIEFRGGATLKPSLELEVSDSEPCIALSGPAGDYSLTIDATRSGPSIDMLDAAWNTRLQFGVREEEPIITLFDAAENLRLAIGNNVTDKETGWGCRVFDSQENCVWRSGQ